jgi:hypothetical protein
VDSDLAPMSRPSSHTSALLATYALAHLEGNIYITRKRVLKGISFSTLFNTLPKHHNHISSQSGAVVVHRKTKSPGITTLDFSFGICR